LPDRVSPADVARFPLVATQHRSNHAQLARDWLRRAGLDFRPAMEIDNIGVIKRVVAVGFGAAIVPEEAMTLGTEVDGLAHRPLDPPLALTLALIRRHNRPDDAAITIVSEAIMSLATPARMPALLEAVS
jgi:DNA-binding transcriptional LysR family regulator